MNKYNFKVKMFGDFIVEVNARNKGEAQKLIKDTINKVNINELKTKHFSGQNIKIKKSNIQLRLRKEKQLAR